MHHVWKLPQGHILRTYFEKEEVTHTILPHQPREKKDKSTSMGLKNRHDAHLRMEPILFDVRGTNPLRLNGGEL